MTVKKGEAIGKQKFTWIVVILGFTLVLAGSVFGADWMNYFNGTSSLYPAIGKPCITLLAFLIVLLTGKNYLERRDWILLFMAFLCMLPTDVLMSVVVVDPELSVGSSTFIIGGVLSIMAHIFLILRVSRGLGYLKHMKLREFWLPVLIYGSAVVILIVLWPNIVKVGHAAIAPAYTAFFCTTMWFSWETVRRKLYPIQNALMVAIAATCWYATEILGEIYNLQMGSLSEITFGLVWVFYGTNVILWALSGIRWHADKKMH